MAVSRKGRIALGVGLAIFLALVVPPSVNVGRYRLRIADSLSTALGRPVTVGNVELRLLPQPGFKLERVSIGEDPAFGIEPVLYSDEVGADLRISSLWRGRLELSKLSFTYPSVNLVRVNGRWNIESLLDRTRSVPAAPTTARHPESRPRFPYIEASGARFNLKLGIEKTVWALSDADLGLWSPSEDEWHLRLAAHPIRNDANLGSDSGELKLDGRFRRAANLTQTPVDFTVVLQKAQLGQLTTLAYGRDRGWRGTVTISLKVTGTPAALNLAGEIGVNDFRRYDIETADNLRLNARCSASYSVLDDRVSALSCKVPLGAGMVDVAGDVQSPLNPRDYQLTVSAKQVPVQSFVVLARHAKRDLPGDLVANGDLDAEFTLRANPESSSASQSLLPLQSPSSASSSPGSAPICTGSGKTSAIVLTSSVLQPALSVPELHFAFENGNTDRATAKRSARMPRPSAVLARADEAGTQQVPHSSPVLARVGLKITQRVPHASTAFAMGNSSGTRLTFEPFDVELGGATPAHARGWFASDEYAAAIGGDAQLARLMQVGRVLGLPTVTGNLTGVASLDLAVSGKWSGFARPLATGSAQVRDITARVTGIASPLKIASAKLVLSRDAVSVENMSAGFADPHVSFGGKLQMPRGCESLAECPVSFELHADQLSSDDLNHLLNPSLAKRPWWEVLNIARGSATPLLARVKANGTVQVNRFAIRAVPLNKVFAMVALQNGVVELSGLHADVFGGRHDGNWRADFTGDQPLYSGTGSFDGVVMAQLSSLMHDGWSTGKLAATYKASTSGWSAAELLKNTMATLDFDWRAGSLRHVSLGGSAAPLQFQQMTGRAEMRSDSITISDASMKTTGAAYQVAGSASTARELKLELRSPAHVFTLTGPLEKPKVTAVTQQAQATQVLP
jgi:hypothetical protein